MPNDTICLPVCLNDKTKGTCYLSITFLLILLFFLGNFVRKSSAKVSGGSIPCLVVFCFFLVFPMEIQ